MAWFEDLQPCTAFPGEWNNLLAVGWLAKGHEYPRGPVDREVLQLLVERWAWEPPGAPTGRHVCEFCSEDDGPRHGTGAIFIPGDGVLFVAPRLIAHYIRKHSYAPPAAFVQAVRAAPERNSDAYRAAVSAHLAGHVEEPLLPRTAYTGPPIRVLEGLEPVRVRPGMYIGPTDSRGLTVLLQMTVGDRLQEYLAGHATRLSVDINEQGWVTVEDDGIGIPIEPEPPHRLSRFELLFTELAGMFKVTMTGMSPARAGADVRIKHGPYLGAAPVNALSARFEVETRLAGTAYRAAFGSGVSVRPFAKAGSTASRGTVIRYHPDDEIFEEGARHDLEAIERLLVDLARLCPGLDLRFQGRSLQRPDGFQGWIGELAPEVVRETVLTATGTVNEIEVEVAFGWRPRASTPLVRSFVNYGSTVDGGSHVNGLVAAVEHVVGQKRASRKKKALSGLVGVVHVGMADPAVFMPGRRLDSDVARRAVREVVLRAINEAPWWWDRIHEAIG